MVSRKIYDVEEFSKQWKVGGEPQDYPLWLYFLELIHEDQDWIIIEKKIQDKLIANIHEIVKKFEEEMKVCKDASLKKQADFKLNTVFEAWDNLLFMYNTPKIKSLFDFIADPTEGRDKSVRFRTQEDIKKFREEVCIWTEDNLIKVLSGIAQHQLIRIGEISLTLAREYINILIPSLIDQTLVKLQKFILTPMRDIFKPPVAIVSHEVYKEKLHVLLIEWANKKYATKFTKPQLPFLKKTGSAPGTFGPFHFKPKTSSLIKVLKLTGSILGGAIALGGIAFAILFTLAVSLPIILGGVVLAAMIGALGAASGYQLSHTRVVPAHPQKTPEVCKPLKEKNSAPEVGRLSPNPGPLFHRPTSTSSNKFIRIEHSCSAHL